MGYNHSFLNIVVTKRDRDRIGLLWRSYFRGIDELEKDGVITTDRKKGRATRISVNVDCLDQKSKDFILKGNGR